MSHIMLRLSFSAVRRWETSLLLARSSVRNFADGAATRPQRPVGITPQQRAALRAARKERASKALAQQHKPSGTTGAAVGTTATSGTAASSPLAMSRWVWYVATFIPSALLVWGFSDENSPPAKFCEMIGLTNFVKSYTDEIAKPSHNKLLPDWSAVRKKVQKFMETRSEIISVFTHHNMVYHFII
jgi:hypothetical protein